MYMRERRGPVGNVICGERVGKRLAQFAPQGDCLLSRHTRHTGFSVWLYTRFLTARIHGRLKG